MRAPPGQSKKAHGATNIIRLLVVIGSRDVQDIDLSVFNYYSGQCDDRVVGPAYEILNEKYWTSSSDHSCDASRLSLCPTFDSGGDIPQ
jgi:hypothetical protein